LLVVADGSKGESGVLQINWLMGNPPEPKSIPPPPVAQLNEGGATPFWPVTRASPTRFPRPHTNGIGMEFQFQAPTIRGSI